MKTIKLSPSQAEIIAHRLEVTECIAENETDCGREEDRWTSDEVEEMADRMLKELERDGAVILARHEGDGEESLRCTIAANCMDCSTYYAAHESYGECDPYHQLALARIERSLVAIQKKFRDVGLDVEIVNW